MMQNNLRRLRRLKFWGLGLLVILAAYGLLKFYIAPAYIQGQLRQRAARYWDGPVEVAHVEFNLVGPVRVTGLTFKDNAGHPWIAVNSADISMGISGYRLVVDNVQAQSVDLQIDYGSGKSAPWKLKAAQSLDQELANFHNFEVAKLNIALSQGQTQTPLGCYSAQAWKQDNAWRFRVVGEQTPLCVDGQLQLTCSGPGVDRFAGSGWLKATDVDLTVSKVVRRLLDFFKMQACGPICRSGIDLEFSVRDSTLSLGRARVTNLLSSFDIESGGAVDLRTKSLDLNVVVSRLEQLRRVLGSMPLCTPGSELLGQVSRVKVTCQGDNPHTLIIKPLPQAGQ